MFPAIHTNAAHHVSTRNMCFVHFCFHHCSLQLEDISLVCPFVGSRALNDPWVTSEIHYLFFEWSSPTPPPHRSTMLSAPRIGFPARGPSEAGCYPPSPKCEHICNSFPDDSQIDPGSTQHMSNNCNSRLNCALKQILN